MGVVRMKIKNEEDFEKFMEDEFLEIESLWDFIKEDLPIELETIDKDGKHYLVMTMPLREHEERLSD